MYRIKGSIHTPQMEKPAGTQANQAETVPVLKSR